MSSSASVDNVPRVFTGLSLRRQLWSGIGGVVTLVLLTWILQSERGRISLTIVFLLYLASVVALAAAGGPVVGVSTSIVAFLMVNWFFTEPLHTLNVSDPERLAELIIFLAVSGTVAALVDTASRRQDVLDVRTAEAKELAATNDLRTALLRAVSHDLRTPLTTAKMATSSLLADDVAFGEHERRELLQLADAEIDRLVAIVENLLDAGRLQAGVLTVDRESVAIRPVLGDVMQALSDDQRTRVICVDDDGVIAHTDRALLERVLANLISNALTASPVRQIELVATTEPNEHVSIAVVDHGPGLSTDQREAALRPFHRFEDRGSNSGIGLGLSICAGFCEAMDAQLELAPTEGGGLTARVLMQAAP